jgi:hypothetical protein
LQAFCFTSISLRADGLIVAIPASAGVATTKTSAATVATFPKYLITNPQVGVIHRVDVRSFAQEDNSDKLRAA